MPKPDPALLEAARYPFSCRIEPRFGDIDVNMHLNNVAMASILEDGRVRFHHAIGHGDALTGLTAMVASIAIEYLGQGGYPASVFMHAAVESVGRTSFQLVQLATQEDRLLAFARTVLVLVGPDGPTAPPGLSEALAPWSLRG